MKKPIITALFVVLFTPGLLFGARPSVSAQEQALNILVDVLVVCPPNSPVRFVDNGDGTVCDHANGLMWEMKDASDGTQDFTNPRDVDNKYTWSSTGTAADGTIFTDFLARLNGEVASTRSSEQLLNYRDWRLPTRDELQSIVDESARFPDPKIYPIFGPTAADNYWSSTSLADLPTNAWRPSFSGGTLFGSDKSNANHVRAVRGRRWRN